MKTQPGYMKLGRLGDAVRKRTEPLVITPRLDEWLAQHDGITLDEKNAELLKTLTTTQPRDRSKSFSSSSRGKCKRFQVFQYLGAPKQQKFNTTLTNLFNDGTWRHLRWQMMLLSANILTDVEVPFNRPELRVRGSLDGINWLENWGFELKGTNQWGYSGVAKDGPMHDHLLQIHTYFLGIPELDKFALVYESKNCVPEYARALTRRGWTHHEDLTSEDEILTFNPELNVLNWEKYKGKAIFDFDGNLYRIGNKWNSFLSTEDHKWFVRDYKGDTSIRLTSGLNSNTWIPHHAPYVQDKESILTPYEAEVFGWWATDGTADTRAKDDFYIINQSKDIGVAALRELLHSEDVNIKSYDHDKYTSGKIYHFYIKGELRDKFRKIGLSKNNIPKIITQLDSVALAAAYKGFLGGDGSWATGGRNVQIGGRDGPVKEGFQILCTLMQIRLNINKNKVSSYPGIRDWVRTYKPVPESYKGQIWCPVTTSGFWLMEQNGKVVITGNTNEWNEIIVHKDPNVMTAVENEIDELNTAVDDRKLPPMIPECRSGTSKTFKDCPYSKICAGVDYEDTEALADQEKHDAANNYQPIKLRRIKSQPVRRIKRARSETVPSRGGIAATRRVAKRSR